jgi:hypothetical protein
MLYKEEYKDLRREELRQAFAYVQLPVPNDSEAVKHYIYLNKDALYTDANEIAYNYARDHFLRNYCDFKRGQRSARRRCSNVKLVREEWNNIVRTEVLRESNLAGYPEQWPWMKSN